MTREIRIAVYGDVNLNILDGSAVWLQSVVIALSREPRNALTVILKAREERDLLTAPLRTLPGVTVINPVERGWYGGPELSRNQAVDVLEKLDGETRFDAVILRGFHLCLSAVSRKSRQLHGRLWPYLTDIPQDPNELTDEIVGQIDAIADASRYLLCQTEALRSHLESWIPAARGKAILLPPMTPDEVPVHAPDPAPLSEGDALRLVYIGKYAPMWNTYEMTQATTRLRGRGVPVELHMVGDKIHRPKEQPGYYEKMERALSSTAGVRWHKAKSREETLAFLAQQHVALGWRDAGLDDSLELSTKLLEYGAVGVPAIVNRNVMHEELLGADYPLFANTADEFEAAVAGARAADVRRAAVQRCAEAARAFTFRNVAAQIQPFLDRTVPRRKAKRPLQVLVVSHDFKFFTRIAEHLGAIRGVELTSDVWEAIDKHDPKKSEELLAKADVIVCEWATNHAVWYSKRKRPGQKLIVRLHRFELYRRYPHHMAFDAIDRVVFVGDYYRDEAIAKLGWPPEKLLVVPNWVDTKLLDRPKAFHAIFNLGMIGIAPMRKRLDRGLTVLERLRAVDDRFQLHVKTKQAWDYPWIWREPAEQAHYREVFRRIGATPALRGAVHFDRFGADVGAWLRKIGFVLSTSDDESFHLAPAEGMASGALPMLLPWAGAASIYPPEHVYADEDAMVEAILRTVDDGTWEASGARAKAFIEEKYSVERVCEAWERLVLED